MSLSLNWYTSAFLLFIFVCVLLTYICTSGSSLLPNVVALKGASFLPFNKYYRMVREVFKGADGLYIHPKIQLPMKRETENVLILGAIGSGKTVGVVNYVIKQLLDDIRSGKRKDKVILYDFKGDFTEMLLGIKDIDVRLLAPWDSRSVKWAIGKDIRNTFDAGLIAEAAIPFSSDGNAEEWLAMARMVLDAAIACAYSRDGKGVSFNELDSLLCDREGLRQLLKDYAPGQKALTNIEQEGKQTQGVFSTLFKSMRWLSDVPRAWSDDEVDFSIRDWLNTDKGGILILRNHAQYSSMAQSLIVMAYNLIMQEHSGRKEDDWEDKGKIFYIIDEFPTLPPIKKLLKAIPTLRSKGGSFILTAQDISQLRETYGKDSAQTILSQSASKVIFRVDGETAEQCSKLLGNQEQVVHKISTSESVSSQKTRPGGTSSEGTSRSNELRTVPVVLAGEMQSLARVDQLGEAQGYLSLSGLPITCAKWPLTLLPKTASVDEIAQWVYEPYIRERESA